MLTIYNCTCNKLMLLSCDEKYNLSIHMYVFLTLTVIVFVTPDIFFNFVVKNCLL